MQATICYLPSTINQYMIPRTDLIYNYNYAKRLYQGKEDFDKVWHRIVALGADFEELYEELIDDILRLIPRYSGFVWEEHSQNFLSIYLVGEKPSFSHPLTLAVDDEPLVMLKDFIYQLAHCNMFFGFTDDDLRDKCFGLVIDYVLEDLGLLAEKKKEEWDLRHKTIKEYLNK